MNKRIAILAALLAVFATQAISDVPSGESEVTFARVQFNMTLESLITGFNEQRQPPWLHDYPHAEDFVLTFLREVTGIHATNEGYTIVRLDDPEIFNYPLLYFSEPGYMALTPAEVTLMREWFDRGGFAWFDDFRGVDLDVLKHEMKRVFPNREMFRLTASHPVFHDFYDIDKLEIAPPYYDDRFLGGMPEFWGMNDDHGRLVLIACQNNDLGEFFEFIDLGEKPLESSSKAMRLTVNFLMYAMTH